MAIDLNSQQVDRLKNLGIEIRGSGLGIQMEKKNDKIWLIVGAGLITLSSFGLILGIKSKVKPSVANQAENKQTNSMARISPSAVSIQKYLLASQQYLSQAIQSQTNGDNQNMIGFLNKSIEEANQAVINHGSDYRAFAQRGRIYLSLISNKTEFNDQDRNFLNQAIADLTRAYQLETNQVDVIRDLAQLYAKSGDASKTIYYLSEAIRVEPTKAQNFYDLAKIQSQRGDLKSALETYKQLIWLITDAQQRQIIEEEKRAIESILATNPDIGKNDKQIPVNNPTQTIPGDGQKIEASKLVGVRIALPGESEEMEVTGITDSNSLSGIVKLTKGETDLMVTNQNLSENSQIYVTTISGGKNQTVRVKSKTDDSFKIGLDVPTDEDIEIRWWIVKN